MINGQKRKVLYVFSMLGQINNDYCFGAYDNASLYKMRLDIFRKIRLDRYNTFGVKLGYSFEENNSVLMKQLEILAKQYDNFFLYNTNDNFKMEILNYDVVLFERPGSALIESIELKKEIYMMIDYDCMKVEAAANSIDKVVSIITNTDEFMRVILNADFNKSYLKDTSNEFISLYLGDSSENINNYL